MDVNLSVVLSLLGGGATVSGFVNSYVSQRLRTEIIELKLEVSQTRERDRIALDEHFVTRRDIESQWRMMEARMGMKIFS